MSEVIDKLERARFLAVQRLRRTDEHAADLLDRALFMESITDESITLHCVTGPDGTPIDIELAALDHPWLESATEDEIADRLSSLIQVAVKNGILPRRSEST